MNIYSSPFWLLPSEHYCCELRAVEVRFKDQNRKPNGQFDFDNSFQKNIRLTNKSNYAKISSTRITKYEKEVVSSAILTDHPNLTRDGVVRQKNYGDYSYSFLVIGKGDYKFLGKIPIKGRVR